MNLKIRIAPMRLANQRNRKSFTKWFLFLPVAITVLFAISCSKRSGKARVLVFGKTAGYHHSSIPNGIAAIQKLGSENNFLVDSTTDATYFNDDSLKNYAAVVFMSTTEDVLNQYQQVAFERYIQSGGGFVGVHAATDTEYDWGWYTRLVGAAFVSHPAQQEAVLNIVDTSIATGHLPKQWKRKDEWYNFKKISKDIKVLITIDEKSYTGGINGDFHPMAWYHEYDGGRSFYTELGHTEESYVDPLYLKHLLGGIQYAIGDNKELDYAKAKSQPIPDEDRFVKTSLTQGTFFEPTEIAILPNLDILVTQRRGEIMMYSDKNKSVKQVGFLNVYYKTTTPGVNAEEGVLGITADPDFKNNNFVYIYYSPVDTSVNRLSRFTFKNDTLDLSSEKVILQLYSQREICCHTGGSLTFGPGNFLFLSTGDNSTPFDEPNQKFVSHGYSPVNDLPGHEQYDARRSSGNTNDLRGKILRIKINPDGTYDIPEGNLFPRNEPKARPEIFVMGNRNPYRISVDKRTGTLYWGEVGPDAGADSLDKRGPRGYDEVNRAAKAGYYGWPLFVGNNYAYHMYNYATGETGVAYDPAKPKNESRNNTGLVDLPPAQPAYIWYPYAASKDFPQVGTGGRNAMAGPVYYTDDYPKETRYPDYFNGKLFIYEWMRDWIKVVTMQPNGDFDKMDPFMEHSKLNAGIDMEVGPDGKIYVLEYGKGWFTQNPDAGLVRIDYISGNRPPKVENLVVDKENGNLPLTFTATVNAKDPENDAMTYLWHVGGTTKETKEPKLTYTLKEAGEFPVTVEVRDNDKAASKSNEVTVFAGNEQPQVDVTLQGNKSFYFVGKPVPYEVKVRDNGGQIDLKNLFIATDYLEGNEDLASEGHQVVPEEILGKNLIMNSDCKSCHKEQEKTIGPGYAMVADKYRKDRGASTYLINKIIKGGAGVWGDVAMPAHPTTKIGDVKQMVTYILSLGSTKIAKTLAPTGTVTPVPPTQAKDKTVFSFTASYTDAGGAGVRPLTGVKRILLRSNNMDVSQFKTVSGFTSKDSSGNKYFVLPNQEGAIKAEQIDLTGIKTIQLMAFGGGQPATYQIEIRTDDAAGTVIGQGVLNSVPGKPTTLSIPVKAAADGRMRTLFIAAKAQNNAGGGVLLKTVRFNQ
jgi:cytochrome c